MMLRWLLAVSLALSLAACGTKTKLDMPNGKPPPKAERDPSQPPQPIGR